jgi:hypothetical protein
MVSPLGFSRGRGLCGTVMGVVMVTVMTVVGGGECRCSSSRYQHHSEKCQGDPLHDQ